MQCGLSYMTNQNMVAPLPNPLENLKKLFLTIVEVLLTAFPNIIAIILAVFLLIVFILFYLLSGTPSLP